MACPLYLKLAKVRQLILGDQLKEGLHASQNLLCALICVCIG